MATTAVVFTDPASNVGEVFQQTVGSDPTAIAACFTDEAVAAYKRSGVPVLYDVCPVAPLLVLQRM